MGCTKLKIEDFDAMKFVVEKIVVEKNDFL